MPFHNHVLGRSDAPEHARQGAHDPLRVIAEASQPHIARSILTAVNTLRTALSPRLLYRAMTDGHGVMYQLQGPLDQFRNDLGTAKIFLANAHLQSGVVMQHRLGLVRKASLQFDLDALPDYTQDALDDYDFGMIQGVSDDTRTSIANIVTRGIREGWGADKMAREMRSSIGLTPAQYNAVANYRQLLAEGNSDALNRQLRSTQFDGEVQQAVDGTRPLSDSQIQRLVGEYEDRYVAHRADAIARFESLRVSNLGASDSVQDAIDNGTVDAGDVTTHWLIADDEITCPKCRSIVDIQPDGVPYGSTFMWATTPLTNKGKPQGGQIDLAPLHPFCRCTNTFSIQSSALEAA